jgi:hypothetical protein
MNAGTEPSSFEGPLGYIFGTDVLPQILLSLVIAMILYITLMTTEMIYRSVVNVTGTRVEIIPYTVQSDDNQRVFEQNPGLPNAKHLPLSDNERTGAEFSYSFYLWVNPNTFRQEDGLLHIMHKGYSNAFPLMGPGVFLRSNTNTLRVYMNSSKTWNNYVDVENIPIKKWVHIAIIARGNALEVYINGNLAKKLNFSGGTIYQNFGNLYVFNGRNIVVNSSLVPSASSGSSPLLQVFGKYTGSLSNLFYFSYALSYTELQSLVAEGPSKKVESSSMNQNVPPYLQDTWWVQDGRR